MHLLIPFAGVLSEHSQSARRALVLPHLQRLLQLLEPVAQPAVHAAHDPAPDEWSLSPPHEHAWAQALGWHGADGQWPWAARLAQLDGLATSAGPDAAAWGLVTPVHWHVGADHVSLSDPAQLQLSDAHARTLFAAVLPLFEGDGLALHWGHATRWYGVGPALCGLPCAALDRVIGRNVDPWLRGAGAAALAPIRRLQAEVQMLLYTHPTNDERESQGLLPVNSFWLSGCGVAQPSPAPGATAGPTLDDSLRQPALSEDWPAWAQAWATLDAGPLRALLQAAQLGQAVRLTLCGERRSLALASAPRNLAQRLLRTWRSPAAFNVLEAL